MKKFDGKIYYPYSEECKREVMKRLKIYYLQDADQVFQKIHDKYMEYLERFNRDLLGKKNSRNSAGGTYDCIFLCCVHELCKEKIPLMEYEEIEKDLILPTFKKLSFANLNKPIFKRLYYMADKIAEKKENKIDDYHMEVEPYDPSQPIRYRFTSCPVADFAKQFGFLDVLPYLCNVDYYSLEMMNAKLVRVHTLGNGEECDYALCGDQGPYLQKHKQYRDEQGYITNY